MSAFALKVRTEWRVQAPLHFVLCHQGSAARVGYMYAPSQLE